MTLTLANAVNAGDTVTVSYAVPGSNPVEDVAGNDAAAFSNQTVTNSTADTTVPTLTTAAINGSTLTLTYDEPLNGSSDPAPGDYVVKVNGSTVTVSGVNATGSTVLLTLANPVNPGDVVTISYVVPGSNPVEDVVGNDAAAFSNQAVTNNTADTTPPTLTTAAINGSTLTLTYNEALDGSSDPAAGTYVVKVNGSIVTVSGVDATGSTVLLTLANPVNAGDTVTVSYSIPGSNPVQDVAGNNAAAFSNQAVTNNTPDTIPPALTTATVNGSTLVLTYDEALNGSSDPATGDYVVKVNGSTVTVSGVDANGLTVTLTLASAVNAGDTVTVSYVVPGSNPVEDVAGNDATALNNQAVTNVTNDTTVPTLTTAAINGSTLTLTYDEPLNGSSDPATGDYVVKVNGSTVTVSGVDATGSTVLLTLANPVTPGDVVTISYVVPGSNPVEDVVGNDAAAFSNQAVTNNTPDSTPPTLTAAAINGSTLTLTYDEALNGSSDPASGDYVVKVNGSVVTVSGVDANGSTVTLTLANPVNAGDAVMVSYYVVPGSNPVEDVAGNDAIAFANEDVTNNTPDTTPPTLTTAAINGSTLTLTYDEALNGSSDPATGDYVVIAVFNSMHYTKKHC